MYLPPQSLNASVTKPRTAGLTYDTEQPRDLMTEVVSLAILTIQIAQDAFSLPLNALGLNLGHQMLNLKLKNLVGMRTVSVEILNPPWI